MYVKVISSTNTTSNNSNNVQQTLSQEEPPNRINDDNDNENKNPLLVLSVFCGQSITDQPKIEDRPRKRTSVQKKFECFDCKDTSFADFQDLVFHTRTHIHENIDMNDKFVFDNVVIEDGIKYHVCEVCGNSYSGNKKLYQHRCKYYSVESSIKMVLLKWQSLLLTVLVNVHPSRTKPKNKGYSIVTTACNEPVQRNISG